jgi:hypothetical protein
MAKFNPAENLCAVLLIMEASGYRANNAVYSNKLYRRGSTSRDLRFLDTLSVALATGDKGDVVAAAFDIRKSPGDVVGQSKFTKILLANNNDRPTNAEKQASEELFAKLVDKNVKTVDDLFDYLLGHCWGSMMRRMEQLCACMDNDLRDELGKEFRIYESEEDVWSTNEFPRGRKCLDLFKPSGGLEDSKRTKRRIPMSFRALWNAVFGRVIQDATAFIDLMRKYKANKRERIQGSLLKQLKAVSEGADALIHSKFLQGILYLGDPGALTLRFDRRLRKVCQFVNGMNELIQRARERRWGQVTHGWVENRIEAKEHLYDGTLEANIKMFLKESPYKDAQRVSNFLNSRGSKQSILDKTCFSPKTTKIWDNHKKGDKTCIRSRLHAKLRIAAALAPHINGILQQQVKSDQSNSSSLAGTSPNAWAQGSRGLKRGLHSEPKSNLQSWARELVRKPIIVPGVFTHMLRAQDINKTVTDEIDEIKTTTTRPSFPEDTRHQIAIGCSKRSCLGCSVNLVYTNFFLRVVFMTSGSHGKAYARWSPLDLNGNNNGVDWLLDEIYERYEIHIIEGCGLSGIVPSDDYISASDSDKFEEAGQPMEKKEVAIAGLSQPFNQETSQRGRGVKSGNEKRKQTRY